MKIKFFAIAAFAATALLASCNRDNLNPDEAGIATSMKVSINFPRVDTRAGTDHTDDTNAVIGEATVNTVDIFIYTASGAFSSHRGLNASDFTQVTSSGTADKYTTSVKIPTTTGPKSVFAGINMPTSVVNALIDQPASALGTAVQTMTRAQLAGGTNFVMFSVAPVDRTFVESDSDPANSITITCQRLVAKITVETDAALDVSGIPGTLSNYMFAVNHFNTKLFMLQGTTSERRDPNWTTASFNQSDFDPAVDGDYAPILSRASIPSPTISQYTPRYAAENTSYGKRKKEITRVTVRALFVPNTIWTGTTGNFTENPNTGTPGTTFYAVTPNVVAGTAFFLSPTVAADFATERGGTVVTYSGGRCYWDIFLGKNNTPPNKWDVLRNDFYKCNITKINALGRSYEDIPSGEEDDTPETDTNISAYIDILFWHTPVLSNYILE